MKRNDTPVRENRLHEMDDEIFTAASPGHVRVDQEDLTAAEETLAVQESRDSDESSLKQLKEFVRGLRSASGVQAMPEYQQFLDFVMNRDLPGIHPDDVLPRWNRMFPNVKLTSGQVEQLHTALSDDGALDSPVYESKRVKGTMKITESQLRKIIRSEILKESYGAGGSLVIGSLKASIPGDERYTDRLTVAYDPSSGEVVVSVSEGAAEGGMDSFYGGRQFGHRELRVPVDTRAIMSAISSFVQNNKYIFKLYGKPTRSFEWSNGARGLSLGNLKAALEDVLSSPAAAETQY